MNDQGQVTASTFKPPKPCLSHDQTCEKQGTLADLLLGCLATLFRCRLQSTPCRPWFKRKSHLELSSVQHTPFQGCPACSSSPHRPSFTSSYTSENTPKSTVPVIINAPKTLSSSLLCTLIHSVPGSPFLVTDVGPSGVSGATLGKHSLLCPQNYILLTIPE